MIYVPVNLASEPFRKTRASVAASVVAAAVLFVLLIVQLSWIAGQRSQASDTRHRINNYNSQLQSIAAQQAKLDAILRRPDNAAVLDRSLLLNALIERKAISWTRLFADLEKVMPYNLELVSVRLPQIDSENRVLLDMVVGAKDPKPVIEFLERLEASPQFGSTQAPSSVPPGQNEKLLRYRVMVHYAQKL